MKKIYLDYAATTPIHPEVFDAIKPFLTEKFGNPSSIHLFGRETRAALDESREKLAKFLGAHPSEIFFTSSGTESINFAIKGVAWEMMKKGKIHIITSKVEHHATLSTCKFLEKQGFNLTYLDVDEYGRVTTESVEHAITPETGLISLMLVNNEVGAINPIQGISNITKKYNIVFHLDAVQAFGKMQFNVNDLGVDLLSLSAHKIYGPKGIGLIYIRRGVEIESLIHGGGQERGRRAGTENVAFAVGFAKAAELMFKNIQSESERMIELRNNIINLLKKEFSFIIINSHPTESLSNILSVSFDSRKIKIDGESLLMNLDLAGIAVSSGSACTSGSFKPSHVITALGRDEETAKATIRFSFGRLTSFDEVKYAIGVLKDIVNRIGKF